MRAVEIDKSEFSPFYAGYIDHAGNMELIPGLISSAKNIKSLISSIPEENMNFAYAEGKWTIKELMLHIIDAERVFQYRALRFLRGDSTNLPGFEQDDYVPASNAHERSKESLLDEYDLIRKSTLKLYENAKPNQLSFVGTASGGPMSARALGFIIIGHETHHAKIIKERYL